MTDQKTGLRKQVQKCGLQVLFEELPHLRGSIDGAQQGANEARNRAIVSNELINDLGGALLTALNELPKRIADDSTRLQITKG